MNRQQNPRLDPIHLYNPKKEGISSYDVNYTNALRKSRRIKTKATYKQKTKVRNVA